MNRNMPWGVKSLLKALGVILLPAYLTAEPYLWKVDTTPPSYLFGTVHSAHPSVRDIPSAVTEALDASQTFHPELEFTPEAIGEMAAHLFRMDNPDLEPQLPPELWNRLRRNAARAGIPEMLLKKIPIELAALPFAAPPGADFGTIMDVQLYNRAVAGGLDVHPLETFSEQVAAFKMLTRDEAIVFLEQALDEFESGFPKKMEILQLYASGDLAALRATIEDEFSVIEDDGRLVRVFLDDRNRVMAERAIPFIRDGGAFVAVGVGHLAGEGSLVELLEAEGFKVSRVHGR